MLLPLGKNAAGVLVERKVVAGVFIEPDQPFRIFEWKRLEQDRADDGEHGDVGADAEGHDESGDDCEARRARERARCVEDIAEKELEPGPAPGGAGLFAKQGGIAEGPESGETRFFRAHAGGDVFGDLAVEVKTQFVVEAGGGRAALEKHGNFHSQFCKPTHGFLLCDQLRLR